MEIELAGPTQDTKGVWRMLVGVGRDTERVLSLSWWVWGRTLRSLELELVGVGRDTEGVWSLKSDIVYAPVVCIRRCYLRRWREEEGMRRRRGGSGTDTDI